MASTNILARFRAGYLLKEIIKQSHFNSYENYTEPRDRIRLADRNPEPKIIAYSVHYVTIVTFLKALGMFDVSFVASSVFEANVKHLYSINYQDLQYTIDNGAAILIEVVRYSNGDFIEMYLRRDMNDTTLVRLNFPGCDGRQSASVDYMPTLYSHILPEDDFSTECKKWFPD